MQKGYVFGVTATIFLALFATVSITSAWTGPTGSPPGNNVSAPVNVGSAGQVKSGDLGVLGNVGIGTPTPWTRLTVVGALGGNIGFAPSYTAWASYGVGDGGAAIYNDNGSYKTLMIVGNNSAGGSRQVGVWDNLTVNGQMNATSYCIAGANCITSWPTGYSLPNGVTIQGTSGRNEFADSESSGGQGPLRVGVAWGTPGIYSESGNVVIGAASGQIYIGQPNGPATLHLYGSTVYDTGTYLHLGSPNTYADGNLYVGGSPVCTANGTNCPAGTQNVVHNDGGNYNIHASNLLINGATWASNWNWSGQGGQPSWLWGSNDGTNMYVWNPSNFSVNYANSAGNANTTDGYGLNQAVTVNSQPQFARIWDDDHNHYIDSNVQSYMSSILLDGALNFTSGSQVNPNGDIYMSYKGQWLSQALGWNGSSYNPTFNSLASNNNISVGGAVLQTDGNLYMPWAGQYLSTALANRPVSTGVQSIVTGGGYIGNYFYCAIAGSSGDLVGSVYPVSGRYADGTYTWYLDTYETNRVNCF